MQCLYGSQSLTRPVASNILKSEHSECNVTGQINICLVRMHSKYIRAMEPANTYKGSVYVDVIL